MSQQQTKQARKADTPQVFICYAREDLDLAQQVYDDLERAGASPWIDREELLAGQKWELIIKQAMKSSSYVLVLLSQTSISKRGFVQHEIKHAVKLSDEFPSSAIFILPVRLEECEPPEELEGLQWVDLFPDYQAGLTQLLKVLAPEGRDELLRRKIQMLTAELTQLQKERGAETDSEQIRRLDAEISEVQVQQEQTETQLEDLDEAPATPPVIVVPTLPLRSEPLEVSQNDFKQVFNLGSNWKPLEYIQNNYEDRGEIVFDRATGLTWRNSGSDWLLYSDVETYTQKLNQQKFAGYNDWRLPTIPELLSLLEQEKQSNGFYIDPIFETQGDYLGWYCSADTVAGSSESAWFVYFNVGCVDWGNVQYDGSVRCVRS